MNSYSGLNNEYIYIYLYIYSRDNDHYLHLSSLFLNPSILLPAKKSQSTNIAPSGGFVRALMFRLAHFERERRLITRAR